MKIINFPILALVLLAVSGHTALAEQKTTGYCSPAVDNTHGNVTTNCYVTINDLRQSVTDKISLAIEKLNRLSLTQQYYMLPSMIEYSNRMTPENWIAVRREVDAVNHALINATEAVISYNADLNVHFGPYLQKLHETLRMRNGLLSRLPEKPPNRKFIKDWTDQYREQVNNLSDEMEELKIFFDQASYKPAKT